jgi:enoyl-CoA hydratase/carnithine racemase
VWIQTKDDVFSHGADYKSLAEDMDYLDKLFKVAIQFAKFNKPLFGQISGGAKGAGAYLLSMMHMPLGYENVFLKLDECSRGMVPLMGGTHRLARLPLRLGFYLALTGDELNYEEMSQLGFIKGTICPGVTNS